MATDNGNVRKNKVSKSFYLRYQNVHFFPGGFIGQARAIDKDEEAKPKDKRYENVEHTIISGDDRHYFTIDLGTGEITTTEEFDYEQKRSYVFKIKVINLISLHKLKLASISLFRAENAFRRSDCGFTSSTSFNSVFYF